MCSIGRAVSSEPLATPPTAVDEWFIPGLGETRAENVREYHRPRALHKKSKYHPLPWVVFSTCISTEIFHLMLRIYLAAFARLRNTMRSNSFARLVVDCLKYFRTSIEET